MKKTVLLTILIFAMLLMPQSYASGCCDSFCQQTDSDGCPGNYYNGMECANVGNCYIGCCIDAEGYCYSNYLKGNCEGLTFHLGERCDEVSECITEKDESSITGSTGYDSVLSSDDEGIVVTTNGHAYSTEGILTFDSDIGLTVDDSGTIIEPIKYGDSLILKYDSFTDISDVKAELTIGSSKVTVVMYDDGAHSDAGSGDDLFAGSFDTATLDSAGSKTIDTVISADGTEVSYDSLNIVVTPSDCQPVNYISAGKKDVVVVNSGSIIQSQDSYNKFIDFTYSLGLYSDLNVYMIVDPIGTYDKQSVTAKAREKCSSDIGEPDYIISVNDGVSVCSKDGNVIVVTNDIRFDRELNESSFGSFCSNIANAYYSSDIDSSPTVTIISPESLEISSDSLIEFIIRDDLDSELDYSINLTSSNGSIAYVGTAQEATIASQQVSVAEGFYGITITVTDSGGNVGYSSTVYAGMFSGSLECSNSIPCSYYSYSSDGTKKWCRYSEGEWQWIRCGICNGVMDEKCEGIAYDDYPIGNIMQCYSQQLLCSDEGYYRRCDNTTSRLNTTTTVNDIGYRCTSLGWTQQ